PAQVWAAAQAQQKEKEKRERKEARVSKQATQSAREGNGRFRVLQVNAAAEKGQGAMPLARVQGRR
ncbi:MAG: hypothetical protein ACI4O7_14870, partial [Aristaeellaceae bacterium]